ncbi:MAG TPA: HAD family phosphatase [Lacisediminihabitans sp.]|uniref:HAD family hydrolase n=1 Tax=Lacisediminihabitans sp. TaxID=2787631 RepID=UPI002ED82F03
MAISIPDSVVVFDYGEVISRGPSQRARAELLAVAGVPAEAFWSSYWANRDGLDAGTTSVTEYWRIVEAEVGAHWSESTIQELWVNDFTGWISVEPETLDVIADLHEGGTRIALLSNAGFDFVSPFHYSPMARFFERIFVSAELSMVKPDAAIYRTVIAELGITAARMIFIDNKQVNVDGAEALGITGHLFVGPSELRTFLHSLADR